MRKLIPLLSLFISGVAWAQGNTLLIAASSSSGTYSKMLGEIIEVCSSEELNIKEVKLEGGATANLSALANNEVSAAFMHSDVVHAAAMADSKYKQLQTLVALYPEEVHIVALRNSKLKRGGTLGIGAKEVVFNALADLRGYKVAAAGGGAVTAKVLQGSGEAGITVVEKASGKELLPALDSGEVQAVLFVGGSPLANIKSLDGNQYKLLSVPEEIANRVSTIYKRATVNYTNLRTGPLKTIAADAIILTRKYKSPKMVEPQRRFRECFKKSLDDLKETPGKHPKWQQVDENDQSSWTWYEMPEVASTAPPAAHPKRK